ncbi:MAG TPA: hypothetical protein VFF73_19320 [Planctomycetota bacterium]|nr:hypothetical protein [Planctomycetota bacterium]
MRLDTAWTHEELIGTADTLLVAGLRPRDEHGRENDELLRSVDVLTGSALVGGRLVYGTTREDDYPLHVVEEA